MSAGKSTYSAIRKNFSGISDLKKEPWVTLWTERFIQYLFIFDIVAIFGGFLVWIFKLAPTNFDNALYFISSMVQAQAAIISLVITLTLIAIQMAAASYTPRVVDVMKKNPDMWYLLIIYVFAISYGFLTLKVVADPDPFLVSSVFILGMFTFLTLFLYMKNTIALLRPDEIVKMLVGEIDGGNIHQPEWTDDIMQPVFDVVHASISRFDVTTTRIGLNVLSDRLLDIYSEFDNGSKKDIAKHFCSHVRRSALVALQHDDEGILEEIFVVLEKHGIGCCKHSDSNIVRPIIRTIEFIAIHCVERNLKSATIRSSRALESIGHHAFENGLDDVTLRVTYAFWRIGGLAADKCLEEPAENIVLALKSIGLQSIDKKIPSTLWRMILSLATIGKHAADKGLDRVVMQVTETYQWGSTNPAIYEEYILIYRMALDLGIIGLKATDKGLNISWLIANVLGIIGERASDMEFDDVLELSVKSLREMGVHTIGGGRLQEQTFDYVIKALFRIGCRDFGKKVAAKHLAYFFAMNKVRITKLADDFKSEFKPEIVKFESLLDEFNAS